MNTKLIPVCPWYIFKHVTQTPLPPSISLLHCKWRARYESNINVWFPFLYSQKWNSYFQNRIIMSVSQFLHPCICERFIYCISRIGLPIPLQENMWKRSWEYIIRSQTHKCENWDWGQAIPRKGILKWDFRCSVGGIKYADFKKIKSKMSWHCHFKQCFLPPPPIVDFIIGMWKIPVFLCNFPLDKFWRGDSVTNWGARI